MAILMLSTSALYFSVAIFGERIESNEAHGQEVGEVGGAQNESNVVKISIHNETQEQLEAKQQTQAPVNESGEAGESPEQKALEAQSEHVNETPSNQSEHNETTEQKQPEGKHVNETSEHNEANEAKEIKGVHEESAGEKQRKTLELPLALGAGAGYLIVGLWMILDKRNSKIPFIIAIMGSLALLGIYAASRSTGIMNLGTEPVGLLDLIVGMLQGGIVAGSLYILFTKVYAIKE